MTKQNSLGGVITTSSAVVSEEIKQHAISHISDEMLEKTVLPGNGKFLLTFLCNDCSVLPFEHFKVYKTKEYKAFSHLAENRELNERHVHALMESFVKDGYLFTIIYVNEKLEIIDGQHRFEAAKRKHLPVYFIVMPNWGIREVAVLNVNSSDWTMEDFMNSYAKGGNENYIRFKEFYDKHPFDITTAEHILFGKRSNGKSTNDFRTGKILLSEGQVTKGVIKARRIACFKDFHPKGWKSRNFVEAMLILLNTKGYDNDHMVAQLKKYPEMLLLDAKSLRVEEYHKIFVEKYNYRKKEKIELI